jgi:hypothetical protein
VVTKCAIAGIASADGRTSDRNMSVNSNIYIYVPTYLISVQLLVGCLSVNIAQCMDMERIFFVSLRL